METVNATTQTNTLAEATPDKDELNHRALKARDNEQLNNTQLNKNDSKQNKGVYAMLALP